MTKQTYSEFIAEDRRITILRILLDSMGYRVNEYLLSTTLDSLAHCISSDQLRTELAWLQEQGVIKVETINDVQIAELTRRGQDVAQGRTVVPGIKRPSASN